MSEDDEREQLTQAMLMLDDGLTRIERKYDNTVCLLSEDPEAFGAGHFVLYPLAGSNSRFAIEEQYAAGTDWSDPDRVPTSWLWRSERVARGPDGTHTWHVEHHGETFPENLSQLLVHAERWARRTHNRAAQTEQFGTPTRSSGTEPPTRSL